MYFILGRPAQLYHINNGTATNEVPTVIDIPSVCQSTNSASTTKDLRDIFEQALGSALDDSPKRPSSSMRSRSQSVSGSDGRLRTPTHETNICADNGPAVARISDPSDTLGKHNISASEGSRSPSPGRPRTAAHLRSDNNKRRISFSDTSSDSSVGRPEDCTPGNPGRNQTGPKRGRLRQSPVLSGSSSSIVVLDMDGQTESNNPPGNIRSTTTAADQTLANDSAGKNHYFGYFRATSFQLEFATKKNGRPTIKRVVGKSARSPDFVIADHTRDRMPHYHILFATSKSTAPRRATTRIGQYLGLSEIELIHYNRTLQRIGSLSDALLYMAKYGIDNVYFMGAYWERQEQIIAQWDRTTLDDCLNHMQADRQERKSFVDRPSKTQLRESLVDIIKSNCQYPYTINKFCDNLTNEVHEYLWCNLGLSWKSHIGDIMNILNKDANRRAPPLIKDKLFELYGTEVPDERIQSWLKGLFERNNVEKAEFLAGFCMVADKKHPKINGFVLEGPTNCFKSNILRLLFRDLSVTPMTRTNGSNQFWLQGCLHQSYALWEEPTISPQDVNDWKLLLEGAEIKISVKNQPDDILSRTPFFITTNHRLGKWISPEDDLAIKERIVKFQFYTQISDSLDPVGNRYPKAPDLVTSGQLFYFLTHG